MANRNHLRSHLSAAWRRTILGPYTDQLINSERGLQVHFCIALLQQFERDGVNRRLFVEPGITFSDGVRRTPDLLICNTKQIIGVVEFKYTPRGRPALKKDLDTLDRFHRSSSDVTIANERFRGEGTPRQYAVAPDAVLCWAGVHAVGSLEFPNKLLTCLGMRFLHLEAVTQSQSPTEIRIGQKRRSG